MSDYIVPQATAAVGHNWSSILRAIKSGKISAVRDDATADWRIHGAEFLRLDPMVRASNAFGANAPWYTFDAAAEVAEFRAHIGDAIRCATRRAPIADLRLRLDNTTEQQLCEARHQVRLLTDQRAARAGVSTAIMAALAKQPMTQRPNGGVKPPCIVGTTTSAIRVSGAERISASFRAPYVPIRGPVSYRFADNDCLRRGRTGSPRKLLSSYGACRGNPS